MRPIHFVTEKQVFLNNTKGENQKLKTIPNHDLTMTPYLDDFFSISTGRNLDRNSDDK